MTNLTQRRLLVTSGDGPQECRRAVSLVLRRIEWEALTTGIRCLVEQSDVGKPGDPASAIVVVSGSGADRLATSWTGTIKWTCKSPFRPHHKRQNWFVGIFEIEEEISTALDLSPLNLKTETFRAGGPGGQHQNTTDSGVRITHLPSGISAISTGERSQHRNRQLARERLVSKMLLQTEVQLTHEKSAQNQKHKQLERGNPTRVFRGEEFKEKK